MSDGPKWMPSNEEIQEHNICPCDDCIAMRYRTGLRAQIAVLEEMQSHFNSPGGEWFGARRNEKGYVQDKIAALRKELE